MKKRIGLCLSLIAACGAAVPEAEHPVSKNMLDEATFPFSHAAAEDYTTGSTAFGAERDGGRLHAGCDLIAPAGEPIYAATEGVVLDYYLFYSGTYAIEVDHGDFLGRYSEVSRMAAGVSVGSKIRRGQLIAYVGRLESGNSMLHFEMYSGEAAGPLTVRNNLPYQRRSDLMNPTKSLVSWPYPFHGAPISAVKYSGFEND